MTLLCCDEYLIWKILERQEKNERSKSADLVIRKTSVPHDPLKTFSLILHTYIYFSAMLGTFHWLLLFLYSYRVFYILYHLTQLWHYPFCIFRFLFRHYYVEFHPGKFFTIIFVIMFAICFQFIENNSMNIHLLCYTQKKQKAIGTTICKQWQIDKLMTNHLKNLNPPLNTLMWDLIPDCW